MGNKQVEFHATKQLLLDTVRLLFETENPGSITSEQVLARARVSSGSLYHHFEDFQDLIELALCREYEEFANRTADLLLEANEQAENFDQWLAAVGEARRISYGPIHQRNRFLRIWAIAYTTNSDRMRVRLGEIQETLNKKWTSFLVGGQQAGYVLPEIDPFTYVVFVQSYALGSVINDFVPTPVDEEKWISLLSRVSIKTAFKSD